MLRANHPLGDIVLSLVETAYEAVREKARTLRWFFRECVDENDVEMARHILVVAHTDVLNPRDTGDAPLPHYGGMDWHNCLLRGCWENNWWEMAKLLREFNLPVVGCPSVGTDEQEHEVADFKSWLGPALECAVPPAASSYKAGMGDAWNEKRGFPGVLASWPPAKTSPAPRRIARPKASDDPKWVDLARVLAEYEKRVGTLRRFEAQSVARTNWSIVREYVTKCGAALYWQESTQQVLAGPDGAGRKRDREAFEADFRDE